MFLERKLGFDLFIFLIKIIFIKGKNMYFSRENLFILENDVNRHGLIQVNFEKVTYCMSIHWKKNPCF